MTRPHPPSDPADRSAAAARLAAAVTALFGSQRAAASAIGVGQSAVSKMVGGKAAASTDLLTALAGRGADVSAILAGPGPILAAVPLFDRFLPGPPHAGGVAPAGLTAVPRKFVVPGAYAVTLDAAAAASLGGGPAVPPRAGDTVVVVTDAAAAAAVAGEPAGSLITLPPPVVLVGGAARLSLAHRVRLGAAEDLSAIRGPLRAELIAGVAGLPPAATGPLPAVGFAVWRSGPVGAD